MSNANCRGKSLLYPFPKRQILDSSKQKEFADDNFKYKKKMAENSSKGKKTLWKKEKLLFTSNFSFSHSVSKDLFCRHVKSWACLGKGYRELLS